MGAPSQTAACSSRSCDALDASPVCAANQLATGSGRIPGRQRSIAGGNGRPALTFGSACIATFVLVVLGAGTETIECCQLDEIATQLLQALRSLRPWWLDDLDGLDGLGQMRHQMTRAGADLAHLVLGFGPGQIGHHLMRTAELGAGVWTRDGAHAFSMGRANLAPIPGGLSDEQVLMCPDNAGIKIGDTWSSSHRVPSACAPRRAPRLQGASTIIGLDGNEHRLGIARKMGPTSP